MESIYFTYVSCDIYGWIFNTSNHLLPVSVPPHTEQSRQPLKEETLYPRGHGVVGCRGAMMDINNKDGDNDGEGDKDHDEQQVLSD